MGRWLVFLTVWATCVNTALGGAPQPVPSSPVQLKQLSLDQLSEIDVTTPTKTPQPVFKSPTAVYVLTGEDIRRSGATSIPEALRMVPGVEVARIDASRWSIGIRGFGSRLNRSVLVLMDGRTVYTTLFDGTYWEVQNTNMDDIDRIEVIRGPGGTIWGPNAVNGVINIITKESEDTPGLRASIGGGNVEQGFANVRYGAGNGSDFNYRVYGTAFTRSPEYHSDRNSFDDWRNVQAGFRMDWKEHDRDAITVQGDAYDEVAGESVNRSSYTPPNTGLVDANAFLTGGNILARWKRVTGDGDDIQLQFFYDRTTRGEAIFGEIRNTLDFDYVQRHRLPLRQEVSWGLGIRSSRAHELVVMSGLTFDPTLRTDMLYSGYLQDEIELIERRLTVTLGTKLLRTNYTEIEAEPSARLMWTPTENESIWTAFTHAVRTPSDVEEDVYLAGDVGTGPGGLPVFARFNANNGFQPEQMNGYELGYRRLINRKVYVDVAGFYNHYHDLLDGEYTGAPYLEVNPPSPHILIPAKFGNGLLGYTKGVEVAPEWSPVSYWRLRGSYSFLHMDIGRAPGSLDAGTFAGIIGSSPQHQIAIQSDFDLTKSLQFNLGYRYVSRLPAQGVSGYSTGNARIAWHFSPEMEVAVVGDNLLQAYHFEYAGDPGVLVGIRRSAYAQLTWGR